MSQSTLVVRTRSVLTSLPARIRLMTPIDLVTVMTGLVVLAHSPYVSSDILQALMFSALLVPTVRLFGPFWIGIALLRFFNQVPDLWSQLDNHQYLITYWCLALGLTLMAAEREFALRVAARLLIGLCFLAALIWKLRSPDFLNGDFFAWKFATDGRLRGFAEVFLGLPDEAYKNNQLAKEVIALGEVGSTEVLETGSMLRPAAIATAWYTVFIEGSVAVLYLLPTKFRAARWAHWALAAFIVTVYPIAPVVGFALVLLTLSVAGNTGSRRWLPIATALFVILPLAKRVGDLLEALS